MLYTISNMYMYAHILYDALNTNTYMYDALYKFKSYTCNITKHYK